MSRTIEESQERLAAFMMKLSTMYTVNRTVNMHGESLIAAQILKQWEHDHGSVKFFRASANFVYLFHKAGKPFFLRFAESSDRTSETIKAEIDILQWVTMRGSSLVASVAFEARKLAKRLQSIPRESFVT